MTTMSPQKQRIAKSLKALGLGDFDGVKEGGVYTIGSVSFKTLKEIEVYIQTIKESKEQPSNKVQQVAQELGVPASEVEKIAAIAAIAAERNAAMKPKHTDLALPIGPGDTKQDLLRKQQDALLSLPHSELIDLYNRESRRLAGNLDVHLVDETCKPLYIVKLLAKLPIRYQMMAAERSNEIAAMSPLNFGEQAERRPTEAEMRREVAPLTKSRPFSIL